jgi:glycosyltransferase involved in cell wall biosynthesis
MLRAQVLSPWEADVYSRRYRIDRERFHFIPWAWRHPPRGARAGFRPATERNGVIAAGRVNCDWPTLLSAAEGQPWTLTVVCPATDLPAVEELGGDGQVTILSEVPEKQVQELLSRSAVSVLAMREVGVSQGHVRLCASVDAGLPIIASATRSLEGYVEDGRTAILVPPGDPTALREVISQLLSDPVRRDDLASAAWDRAERWTWEEYLRAISGLLAAEPAVSPQAAASASAGPRRREITFETPSPPIDTPYR